MNDGFERSGEKIMQMPRALVNRVAPLFLGASVVAMSSLGCSGSPSATQPIAKSSATTKTIARRPLTVGEEKGAAPCTPDPRGPKTTAAIEPRTKGVKAVGAGRAQEALRLFEKALEQNPSDTASFTLHLAASADLSEERAREGRTFGRLKAQKLEAVAPPHKNLAHAAAHPALTIKRGAEERQQGDWIGWLSDNELKNPVGFAGQVELPAMFGQMFNELAVHSTHVHEQYVIVRYGPGLLVIGQEGKGMRALDLWPFIEEAFGQVGGAQRDALFPEVRYAEVSGSTLVAQIAHEGDSLKVKPDGFLIGVDLEKDKVLWVSDAQVTNSYASYMTATHYITSFTEGNGGTLNVVDIATGAVVASEKVPARIDYVTGKGDEVFAWGYDRTISFQLSSAPVPVAPKLGALIKDDSQERAALEATQQCWLENAVIALDHRDGKALLAALPNLPDDASVTRALQAAGDFLMARASGTPGLDLTEKVPIPAQFVTEAFVAKNVPKPSTPSARLLPAKDPALQPPKPPFPPSPTPTYSSIRTDLYPSRYGIWHLEAGWPIEDAVVLQYGRRFLVTVQGDQVESIVDLEPLLGDSGKGSARTPAYAVTVLGGVAYVVVSPQTTRTSTDTSYIAALDPRTGKQLWRTAPGTLARPIIVFGDYILAAQNKGKGGELLFIRLADGQIVSTTRTRTAIGDFGWDSRGAIFAGLPPKREYFTVK